MNDEVLLTRAQIGSALGYANPEVALSKIHNKHKDRLDQFSVLSKTVSTDGKEYDTILYTEKGVMEICRWSRQAKANQFMDWVWEIVDKFRNGELNSNQIDMTPIVNSITELTTQVINLCNKQEEKMLPRKSYCSRWYKKMSPKYDALISHFGISRKELYHNLFLELENTYEDVDIKQLQDDYCYENGIQTCYPMDAIEHNENVRLLFESIVDSLLEKYQLSFVPYQQERYSTIFDN